MDYLWIVFLRKVLEMSAVLSEYIITQIDTMEVITNGTNRNTDPFP